MSVLDTPQLFKWRGQNYSSIITAVDNVAKLQPNFIKGCLYRFAHSLLRNGTMYKRCLWFKHIAVTEIPTVCSAMCPYRLHLFTKKTRCPLGLLRSFVLGCSSFFLLLLSPKLKYFFSSGRMLTVLGDSFKFGYFRARPSERSYSEIRVHSDNCFNMNSAFFRN